MTMWPAADDRLSSAHRRFLAVFLASLALIATVLPGFAQDAEVTPPAEAPTLSVTFVELNDSGVSGIATLYGDGNQTIVEINVEDAGPLHPAHIHSGDCDDLDPNIEYPLENVIDGRSVSVVDASLDELLNGDFSIDLHLSANELGTLIVCAPIEGEATDGTGSSNSVGGGDSTTGDGTGGAQMSDDTASLPLTGLNGNGVTGILSLTALEDDQTDVVIQLSGDAITGNHIAHLHLGTCDDLADEGTIDLEPVDASGLSETTVDVAFTELLEGGYAVNVHESEANYETWLVCTEFSDATVGAVIPEVAPDTGSGSVNASPTVEPTPTPGVLPASVGTGFGLPGAETPISPAFWAMLLGGGILILGAYSIRRGERTPRSQPARWRRLGL